MSSQQFLWAHLPVKLVKGNIPIYQIAGKTEALSEVSGKHIFESGGEGNRWNREVVVILGRILATVEITKGSK